MLLTLLKIVAGVAVIGIISMVLIAVVSGLVASVKAARKGNTRDDPARDSDH